MPTDQLRYDILVQDALRGMVRKLLADTARHGLPGEHHFFITFDTTDPGVRLSPRLRERYPEEMSVVLQYQYRDLKVSDEAFEVGLSFNGVPERLTVPFTAITGFADPSVQFALQFETLTEGENDETEAKEDAGMGADEPRRDAQRRPRTPPRTSVPASPAPQPGGTQPAAAKPAAVPGKAEETTADKAGAEVVRLDRFRKK
jgi:hypothetical protein